MQQTDRTFAAEVPFSEFCVILEKISLTKSTPNKKCILSKFFGDLREFHAKFYESTASSSTNSSSPIWKNDAHHSLWPILRLLCPADDKHRAAYGIKQSSIASLLVDALCLGRDSTLGKRLLHFKAADRGGISGVKRDFADLAFDILKPRARVEPDRTNSEQLSVRDVNQLLDNISAANKSWRAPAVATTSPSSVCCVTSDEISGKRSAILYNAKNTADDDDKIIQGGESKCRDAAFWMRFCVREMSALEQKWVIRLVLRDLALGLNLQSVLACFQGDAAVHTFNTCHDLQRVALDCHHLRLSNSNDDAISAAFTPQITLFQPFKVMLADRLQLNSIGEQINAVLHSKKSKLSGDAAELGGAEQDALIVEVKLDGERVQMHFSASSSSSSSKFRFWSRTGNEWTETYRTSLIPFLRDGEEQPSGGVREGERRVCAFIRSQREGGGRGTSSGEEAEREWERPVRNCILDGEMMGFCTRENRFITKTDVDFDVKRFSKLSSSSSIQTCFVVFDVVMLNDRSISDWPLAERKELLQRAFQPVPGHFLIGEWSSVRGGGGVAQIVHQFNARVLANHEEGLMVKLAVSRYLIGQRHGAGWFKLKPDYVTGLHDELDVAVVGAYRGANGQIAQLLLAVLLSNHEEEKKEQQQTEVEEEEEYSLQFLSFCKVDAHANSPIYAAPLHKLESDWIEFSVAASKQTGRAATAGKAADWLKLAGQSREKPDLVLANPRRALLVQLKAAELQPTDRFATGITTRFPRIDRFRLDNDAHTDTHAHSHAHTTNKSDKSGWRGCMRMSELQRMFEQSKRSVGVRGKGGNLAGLNRLVVDEADCVTVAKRSRLADDAICTNDTNIDDVTTPTKVAAKSSNRREERSARESPKKPKFAPQVAQRFRVVTAKRKKDNQSKVFAGKEFCVMVCDGDNETKRARLERIIQEGGGRVVRNPGRSSTAAIVTDSPHHFKVANLIRAANVATSSSSSSTLIGCSNAKNTKQKQKQKEKQNEPMRAEHLRGIIPIGHYNVVHADWLVASAEANEWLPWHPSQLFCATAHTHASLATAFDRFGDQYNSFSLTEEVRTQIDRIVAAAAAATNATLMTQHAAAAKTGAEKRERVCEEFFTHFSGFFPFASLNLFVVLLVGDGAETNNGVRNDVMQMYKSVLEAELRGFGANIAGKLSDLSISHVILVDSDLKNNDEIRSKSINEINAENFTRNKHFFFVSYDWVKECIREKRLIDERPYLI